MFPFLELPAPLLLSCHCRHPSWSSLCYCSRLLPPSGSRTPAVFSKHGSNSIILSPPGPPLLPPTLNPLLPAQMKNTIQTSEGFLLPWGRQTCTALPCLNDKESATRRVNERSFQEKGTACAKALRQKKGLRYSGSREKASDNCSSVCVGKRGRS